MRYVYRAGLGDTCPLCNLYGALTGKREVLFTGPEVGEAWYALRACPSSGLSRTRLDLTCSLSQPVCVWGWGGQCIRRGPAGLGDCDSHPHQPLTEVLVIHLLSPASGACIRE